MTRAKKGISSILAALFMIAIIVGGINLLMFGMNQYDLYNAAVVERTSAELNKISEEFEITDARIDGNKFNLTVSNTGSVGVGLMRLWVTNQTDGWYNNYTLTDKLGPGQSVTNIGQSLSPTLYATNSSSYLLKVVSERGNMDVYKLASTKDEALNLQLFALPRNIPTQQEALVLLSVNNNMTDAAVQNLLPNISITTTGSGAATPISGPTPSSLATLREAETVFFEWTYTIAGNAGDIVTFNATLANAKQGNWATADVEVQIDLFAQQSTSSLESQGLTSSTPDTANRLHFHSDLEPYIPATTMKRMESTIEDGPEGTQIFDQAVVDDVIWISANSTETITISPGQWNYTIWGKCDGGTCGTAIIQLKLEKTDANGTPVIPQPLGFPWITTLTTTDKTEKSYNVNTHPSLGTTINNNIILNPQERLKVTVSWGASGIFKMWFDQQQGTKISLLTTPDQTPPIPGYNVYTGNNVEVTIRNTGPNVVWIDSSSRIVFRKFSTNETYGGVINGWINTTSGAQPPSGSIGAAIDSPEIAPTKQLKFTFTEPRKIPGGGGANNPSVKDNPGTYKAYVRLNGYDEFGGFLFRVINLNFVVVS